MDQFIWLAGGVIVLMVLWLVWSLSRKAGSTTEAPPTPMPRPRPAAPVVEDAAATDISLALPPANGPPDDLRRIKGVGPKLNSLLGEFGVSRYDQIASLSGEQLAHLDGQLGTFQGRAVRDNWIEQADLLARGDTAGFEAKFGKLGG